MYAIIWEYQVETAQAAEFEKTYASDGAWAKLFQKSAGFLDTQLLRDQENPRHYITIDRWSSSRDYESFRSQWKVEYEELDSQTQRLTEQETLLGRWETR